MTSNKKLACIIGCIFLLYSGGKLARAGQDVALSIGPPLMRVALTPGESWSSELHVTNHGSETAVVAAESAHLRINEGETETKFAPTFLQQKEKQATLAGWITIATPLVSIEPNSAMKIPFTIHVPNDATPGGHYASILVGQRGGLRGVGGAEVSVSTKLASIVMARVAGEIHERVDVKEWSTLKRIYTGIPVELKLRIINTGNTYVEPRGVVRVVDSWGRERKVLNLWEDNGISMLLPQQEKTAVINWYGPIWFGGYYYADVELAIGEENTMRERIGFFIIPVWMIGIAAVFVVFSVILLVVHK